jgi:hypothetical protein
MALAMAMAILEDEAHTTLRPLTQRSMLWRLISGGCSSLGRKPTALVTLPHETPVLVVKSDADDLLVYCLV